jgi:hypothetical protein
MLAFMLCTLVSLAATVGLYLAPPRPRAQEAWAILALAPLFTMVVLAMLAGSR